MNRRKMGLGVFAGLTMAAAGLVAGCSSGGGAAPEERGTLSLPLSTQGPSGATYRLRDATFEVRSQYYYYSSSGGEGGAESPSTILVSSETNPDASSISVNLEGGYYYVRLRPGWHMEKVEGGVATDVEAQLLSSATQWVYVAPHSTSWVEYQFGIGDRALWFNGNLNLQIQVYEDPSELYGGFGGEPNVGGAAGFGGEPTLGGQPSGVGGSP